MATSEPPPQQPSAQSRQRSPGTASAPPGECDWIEAASTDIHALARDLVRAGTAARVSDAAVARIMTAAIRLYAAKSDGEERTFSPVVRDDNEPLTATEVLTAVSELLRALRLGPMELALWYRRRPDEP
jgi:hypothetical protein